MWPGWDWEGWERKWELTARQVLRKRVLAFNMQGVREVP